MTRAMIFLEFALAVGAAERPMGEVDDKRKTEYLEISADREDGIYRQGDTVRFNVVAKGLPKNAKIKYSVQLNGAETIKSGVIQPETVVEVKAEKPGFLGVAATSGKSRGDAVVGVDPARIKPSAPPPADFKEFWRAKKAELAAKPLNARLKPIAPIAEAAYKEWNAKWPVFGDKPFKFKEVETFELEADTSEGNPVRGYYSRPAGARAKSLPAVLFTHGAGIGDSDFAKSCVGAKYGFLSLDINAHGLLQGQPPEYYQDIERKVKAEHGSFFKQGRLDKKTLYAVTMYLRHRRALDFLCSQPEWDGKNLIVRGASQGGGLALACAGLDERVSRVCAGVPSFCDTTDAYMFKKWFIEATDDARTVERVREAVRYISIANFAPDIKAEAYFTVAFRDGSCSPSTVYAAYNVYGGPKKIYNGPTADHGGIPLAIHYDDFMEFSLGHVGKLERPRP